MTYDAAVAELYRARLDVFVAERKRLAAELKAAGDKAGAARFAKLARPSISAWAVNQLWWQARPEFEELLGVAARLRGGDRAATVTHRELLARLRTRAGVLLGDAGHAATEATLRRVTTTLSAIVAAGTFAPDPAGALAADRDPPGFEAAGFEAALASPVGAATSAMSPTLPTEPAAAAEPVTARQESARRESAPVVVLAEALERRRIEQERERGAAAERAAAERAAAERAAAERAAAERAAAERAAAERAAAERAAAERAKRVAELGLLEEELRSVTLKAEAQRRDVDRLRRELSSAEAGLQQAEATIGELQARRAALASEI